MAKKVILLFVIAFFGTSLLVAQTHLEFELTFKNQALKLEQAYFLENLQDSLSISQVKFYISNIRFLNEGKEVFKSSDSYHLVNAEMAESLHLPLSYPQNLLFNHLGFEIGIDSTMNAKGVFAGDLDPMHNMYWTWQSGYINVKIEGKTKAIANRDHGFQFHLGGYKAPFNTIQTILMPVNYNRENPVIKLDIGGFLEGIDFQSTAMVMSPNAKAVQLSKQFSTHFIFKNAF